MSDYTEINNYTAKGALPSGDPDRLILGADIDAELAAIQTAVTTKYDSNDVASQATAEAGVNNAELMTPLRTEQHQNTWADENGGLVGSLHEVVDPNVDALIGWDDSAGGGAALSVTGNGVEATGTTLALDINSMTGETATEPDSDMLAVDDGGSLQGVLLEDILRHGEVSAVKTATTSRANTTTFADDPHLSLYIEDTGSGWYTLECLLMFDAQSVADIKFAWTYDFASNLEGFGAQNDSSGSGVLTVDGRDIMSTTYPSVGHGIGSGSYPSGAERFFHWKGAVKLTYHSNITLQWAQNVSNGTASKLFKGSWIRATKLT